MTETIIPRFRAPHDLTPLQLQEASQVILSSEVPSGYPELTPGANNDGCGSGSGRLFMEPTEVDTCLVNDELYGHPIIRLEAPFGHDAISHLRDEQLKQTGDGRPFPFVEEFYTGQGARLGTGAVRAYLQAEYRLFDQHDRPLAWSAESLRQIVSLRSEGSSGKPLGMPTGYGAFVAPGQQPMTKSVVFSGPSNDPAILMFSMRTANHARWRVFRGYGNRLDLAQDGYRPALTAQRSLRYEAGVEVAENALRVVTEGRPVITARTTIHAALFLTAFIAYIKTNEKIEARVPRPHTVVSGESKWVKARSLLRLDNTLIEDGCPPIVTPADRQLIEMALQQVAID